MIQTESAYRMQSQGGCKMRILIVAAEVWRSDTSGGNTFTNLFNGMDAEFAQIYCNPGMPSNKICKKYYQFTDIDCIRSILKRQPAGRALEFEDFPDDEVKCEKVEKETGNFYSFFRHHRVQLFYVFKELIWKFSDWKNKEFETFVKEFDPDIIFAPCYGSHILLAMDRYVAELTRKPVISYIMDDHYSMKQFRLSLVYWLNRLALRRNLRKTFPYYDLTYTTTEEQMKECIEAFGCSMKILRKGSDILEIPKKETVNKPIRLIYGGNIYCGRWKTLGEISKALREINKGGVRMVLDIYSGNEIGEKQKALLDDGVNSFFRGAVPPRELKKKYRESDIAIHAESFELQNRLITRLSFSTKIVDCLASGCAVMAVCWNGQSGYRYLKREDAAICIDDLKDIGKTLKEIVDNPDIIRVYAEKAYACSERNHRKSMIQKEMMHDFETILEADR
ncbi:Glycosyltransferase involved in cell wall bisynthesis [Anaerobium acetethylicum]|uniref:Glycosyltransferase involved in cell wall bisynthesis n=2 Tax=Anaerobium acetethylicum TaxID=1619234 RepID=A0A1D3TRE3_9FIRM|nr:Glycosyltransferase involved in cell wall bisynthesis [Anaerobium acetethylicum]